jgi:UDP-N-acetylglucosamine diphosphorylase / glucose-1-phosphate thymidylyltransferase / UDP-N-acetylgalactosamine diphosphorylase / glucosamine-1-phosphate N-acetyltransferase / galactosamine-1-phosphate N-acetyltransferase
MKAVILAAGKGTRMEPLSLVKDKPLLKIFGKTILERNLDQLIDLVKEVILIIRPNDRGRAVISLFGKNYKGLQIKYVVQKKPQGTGKAAQLAIKYLNDRFLLLNGDDIYSREDIKTILKNFPSILVKSTREPKSFGIVEVQNGTVKNLVEKPKSPKSNLANVGVYFLPTSIFNYDIGKSKRGEYEFVDYIRNFIKENKLYYKEAQVWLSLGYCWNILEAHRLFLSKLKVSKKGKIEEGCSLKGKIIVGKGTIIKSGTYIEGPVSIGENCVIGPNCYIRSYTSIGDNCHIGQSVEIENSMINEYTNIAHLSYVVDSIVSAHCNLGAGTITANLRHDGQTVKTMIKGILLDTHCYNFGSIIGEGTKTGIGTLIYPGCKIWPNKITLPGEIIKKDVK